MNRVVEKGSFFLLLVLGCLGHNKILYLAIMRLTDGARRKPAHKRPRFYSFQNIRSILFIAVSASDDGSEDRVLKPCRCPNAGIGNVAACGGDGSGIPDSPRLIGVSKLLELLLLGDMFDLYS